MIKFKGLNTLKTSTVIIQPALSQFQFTPLKFLNHPFQTLSFPQTKCQDQDEETGGGEEEEDEEAEFDSMLVESAGELLPSLAKVLGGEAFAPYFQGFLPELVKKTVWSDCP